MRYGDSLSSLSLVSLYSGGISLFIIAYGKSSLVYQTTPSPALDVLHHRASDAIHPELEREWSGTRD